MSNYEVAYIVCRRHSFKIFELAWEPAFVIKESIVLTLVQYFSLLLQEAE